MLICHFSVSFHRTPLHVSVVSQLVEGAFLTHLFVTLAIRWRDLNLHTATFAERMETFVPCIYIYRVFLEIVNPTKYMQFERSSMFEPFCIIV